MLAFDSKCLSFVESQKALLQLQCDERKLESFVSDSEVISLLCSTNVTWQLDENENE